MALLSACSPRPAAANRRSGRVSPEDNVVVADGRHRGDDPYEVNSAAIDGHRLTIEVSYSGGCRRHDFTLVISKSFRESDLVQLPAALTHDANGDTCEAYPTESASSTSLWSGAATGSSTNPVRARSCCKSRAVPGDDLVYEFDG